MKPYKILIPILSVLCIASCKQFKDDIQLYNEEQIQLPTQEEVKELIHECHYKLHSHLNAFDDCEWCIEENWVVPPPENKN
jgi:hypothetical protein